MPVISVAIRATMFLIVPSAYTFAQGGPPLVTDDPYTPGDGHWEINTLFTIAQIARDRSYEAPHVDLNYGLGDSIQLKYEGGILISKDEAPVHKKEQTAR